MKKRHQCLKLLCSGSMLLSGAACKGQPARLMAGFGDTVVLNNELPVQLSVKVFDRKGHLLPDTGVRFQWTSAVNVPLSRNGAVTCTHPVDATARAALGPLTTSVLVRCRPVHKVYGGGPVNLVLGDPPYDLLFGAVDSAGRPVSPLVPVVTVDDSTIVTLDGWRIRAHHAGTTGVDVWVGDEWVHWFVQVFEPALTLDGIRPGQHLAVPVQLAAGAMRSWRLPVSPKNYWLAILPDRDTLRAPRLAIAGAVCEDQSPWGTACLGRHGATVFVYHPRRVDPAHQWLGMVAVVRQERP